MHRKGLQLAIITMLLVAASACQPRLQPPAAPSSTTSTRDLLTVPDHHIIPFTINTHQLQVEVVNTPASITQGLSGRETIGSDGMLFALGPSRIPHFWMKQMRFDLDFVWLQDERVVDITTNVPRQVPNTPDEQLMLYQPKQPVNVVLELPAGTVERLGITIGDQAQW